MRVRMRHGICCIVMLLAGLAAPRARAQDSNYWTSAYGTRSQLLGGVVIGSPGDISAVYYNPGAFALAGSAELLLAGNAYQYQSVSVDDGAGPKRTLSSTRLSVVPSLFAGEIPILKHDRLAYSFLTRHQMDMTLDSRTTTGVESVAPIADPVFAASEIQLRQNMTENWFGVTWAHPISRTLGVGISPYLAVRSQDTRVALLFEGRDAAGAASILSMSREYDYLHWRLLARLGLAGSRDSLSYGVTLTTPSLGLFGGGNSQYNTSLIDQTGANGTITGADYEQDLKVDYRSPLGAGAGASYGWSGTRVHVSVEWYDAVPRFTVLETPAFTVRTPGGDSTVTVVITQQLHSVFNWGLGLEHRFSPTLVGFASYHTDESGRDTGQPVGASVSSADLNHVAAGVTWHVWRSDFAFGASTAFASQPLPRLPPRPDGEPTPEGLQSHVLAVTLQVGWKVAF